MTFVSLVVPAYNEGEGIARSLTKLDEALSARSDVSVEFVVVNDGSSDNTLEIVSRVASTLKSQIIVIDHDRNQGLGGALRTGFANTRGDIVIAVDADLSYGIEDIFAILDESIRTGAHVVIASPYMPGGRSVAVPRQLERRSRMANRILGLASINQLYTVTGMVRAYDGAHIRGMSLKAVDIDINSEIVYKTELLRGTIIEIPATLDWSNMQERASRSSLTSRRSRWNTAKALVNAFLFRPFIFPLVPIPAVLLLCGAIALLVGGDLGLISMVGGLIVTGLLVLASVLMLQLKRYFEETYSAVIRLGRSIDHPSHARVVYESNSQSRLDNLSALESGVNTNR